MAKVSMFLGELDSITKRKVFIIFLVNLKVRWSYVIQHKKRGHNKWRLDGISRNLNPNLLRNRKEVKKLKLSLYSNVQIYAGFVLI